MLETRNHRVIPDKRALLGERRSGIQQICARSSAPAKDSYDAQTRFWIPAKAGMTHRYCGMFHA